MHPQQVQAEVHAGGAAAGGEYVTVIDEQLVRAHVDRGVLVSKLPGLRPVRGGGAAIEQPGRGQYERARAHGRHVCTRRMRRAQRREQRLRRDLVWIPPVRDDHQVRILDRV